jgi:hypothetical protein
MVMSSFEEEFPCLKKQEIILNISVESGNGMRYYTDEILGIEVFKKDIIELVCLDKQRVRQEIDAYWNELIDANKMDMAGAVAVLKQRLGL